MNKIPTIIMDSINEMKQIYSNNIKTATMYEKSITNTLLTTLFPQGNNKTFVITGDIPAMWLRDSAAQVRPLLMFAKNDNEIFKLLQGVINQQFEQILIDPYANAFNNGPTNEGHQNDKTLMKPEIWERKYEIDSLCYPIQLAYLFWKSTDSIEHFDDTFKKVCSRIIDVFKTEQYHMEKSPYSFERLEKIEGTFPEYETLKNNGKGKEVGYTGMTWSGFRPSDDACTYGYLIPSNMFAVVILRYIGEISDVILKDDELSKKSKELANEIHDGIQKYGIIEHPVYGEIYAYEVDGLGNYNLMDDANVPSLLSIPYLGYTDYDDRIYMNTRRFILSKDNPFYFEGKVASGVGSPHTPSNYIWHIALAVQAMSTLDNKEHERILNLLMNTDAGTNLMHEGFDVDNPENFTRPWFSWANSMFAEFILLLNNKVVEGSPMFYR